MWLVTKDFGYIAIKSRGLLGEARCVLCVWLVGSGELCGCYGVGVVCLGVWRVLGSGVM